MSKEVNNSLIVEACRDIDKSEDIDPEACANLLPLRLYIHLMHIFKLLQTWLIEIDREVGVMNCTGQGGLHAPSALSSVKCNAAECLHLLIGFSRHTKGIARMEMKYSSLQLDTITFPAKTSAPISEICQF